MREGSGRDEGGEGGGLKLEDILPVECLLQAFFLLTSRVQSTLLGPNTNLSYAYQKSDDNTQGVHIHMLIYTRCPHTYANIHRVFTDAVMVTTPYYLAMLIFKYELN